MSNPEGNSAESERCGHRALSGWAGPLAPPTPGRKGCVGRGRWGCCRGRRLASARLCCAPLWNVPAPSCPSTPTSRPSCSGPHPGSGHFGSQCSEQRPTDLRVPVPSCSSFCSRVTFSGASRPPGCLSPSQPHSLPASCHPDTVHIGVGMPLWEENPQNRSLVSSELAC